MLGGDREKIVRFSGNSDMIFEEWVGVRREAHVSCVEEFAMTGR